MRRGSGSSLGGLEGPRHAGNAYAGEHVFAQHDLAPSFRKKKSNTLCDLDAKRIRPNPQLIF
jgi:hypothetical protein